MRRDDDAYQDFVVARYRTLVRAAVLFGCSRQDAEDSVQEALIRCYRAWPRVTTANDPDAYVYRVLVNGISRGWRRKWRGESPYNVLPEPAPAGDPADELSTGRAVRVSLARLGLQHRQVLVLRYFVDLTEAQIADVLEIAPGTVKSRASRAIAELSSDESLTDLLYTRREEDR